jgi:hypothetical protein
LFIELHEQQESPTTQQEEGKAKDQRFILLNPISSAKLLLLDPKLCNPNDLQTIEIAQRFRVLEVQQMEDKKFTVTIKVAQNINKSGEILDDVPGEKSNMLISHIELNPEDIILMQKFVNMCIDDLLNI